MGRNIWHVFRLSSKCRCRTIPHPINFIRNGYRFLVP
uniref:Uncharacterized protein n=1 Tax=Triticum urartu TaxID=4572 RepID=A0A8R7PK98_TRIUA